MAHFRSIPNRCHLSGPLRGRRLMAASESNGEAESGADPRIGLLVELLSLLLDQPRSLPLRGRLVTARKGRKWSGAIPSARLESPARSSSLELVILKERESKWRSISISLLTS